ncbi:hypothetical protein EJ110_NYTH32133 [Nymphaea thermarum]|nr:hypothetical protein EJ110_NYTH32133 [Nymphaea thermarum]
MKAKHQEPRHSLESHASENVIPCILQRPIKVLADLLQNGRADIREPDLAELSLRKTTYHKPYETRSVSNFGRSETLSPSPIHGKNGMRVPEYLKTITASGLEQQFQREKGNDVIEAPKSPVARDVGRKADADNRNSRISGRKRQSFSRIPFPQRQMKEREGGALQGKDQSSRENQRLPSGKLLLLKKLLPQLVLLTKDENDR